MLWIDGFDNYSNLAQFLEKWEYTSGNSVSTSGGRTGGYTRLTNDFNGPRKILPLGAHATWIVGFAMDKRSNGGTQSLSFWSNAGSQPQFVFLFDTRITAKAYSGGSVPDTSSPLGQSPALSVPASGYDYYECMLTLSATVGVARVCKNGVEILTLTGINTKPNSGTTIDGIQLQTYAGQPDIDDLYILNGAGTVNNAFCGDCRVRQIVPTGAGSNTGFTPLSGSNYQNVDEVPFNTTDYNTALADGTKDTYSMTDIPDGATALVFAAMTSMYVAKTEAGTKYAAGVVRSGGTDYVRASQPLSTTFREYTQIEELNPATASVWSTTTLNAAEFGLAAKDS